MQENSEQAESNESLSNEIVATIIDLHWRDHRKAAIQSNTRGLNAQARIQGDVADLLSELYLQVTGRRPQDWQ